MTNNFSLSAFTITELYRCRWQIELFFRWIRQHLRVKHILDNCPNALHTQLWIVVSVYVLIAIVRKERKIQWCPRDGHHVWNGTALR